MILNKIKYKLVGFAILVGIFIVMSPFALADGSDSVGFTVSPLREEIVLNPGETYRGTFKVSNPGVQTSNINYEVDVQPFYVDENYNNVFGIPSNRSLIADWISIVSPKSGLLSPNETAEIIFEINVPNDAPAGGQYADIRVSSTAVNDKNEGNDNGSMIGEKIAIGHLVYAEITGETVKQGEIVDAKLPSFLLSGNITGSSSIKNTGNVHSEAKYTLQVFPLFSGEELFTNEENPDTKIILPDRTLYNETVWDKTPPMGIFNVVYTVEFEGVTTQVSKMVIKCPIWLLFIIIFVIAAIIIYFIAKARKRNIKKATA